MLSFFVSFLSRNKSDLRLTTFDFLLILVTLLALSFSTAIAADAYVDNKSICEANQGNWRLYNNNCADSCASKFDALLCTEASSYACDCGPKRCWDNNRCIADKIAKAKQEAKIKKEVAKRAKEKKEFDAKMEEYKIKVEAYNKSLPATSNNQQNNHNQNQAPIKPQGLPQSNQIVASPAPPLPGIVPTTAPTPNPNLDKQNLEQKQICEKQNGIWQQFNDGCVDSCGSKVAVKSICTVALTFGCKCGGSKCWNNANSTCVELEDYKKSFTIIPKPVGPNSGSTLLPTTLPTLPALPTL